MDLLVQWTRSNPRDYERVDSWADLPKKPEPVGGEVIDDSPGWVYGLSFGVRYLRGFDHYRVAGGDVLVWNDDPEDFPFGRRHAYVYLADGRRETYGEPFARQHFTLGAEARPWSAFVLPPEEGTLHGIWISRALAREHERTNSWRVTA